MLLKQIKVELYVYKNNASNVTNRIIMNVISELWKIIKQDLQNSSLKMSTYIAAMEIQFFVISMHCTGL